MSNKESQMSRTRHELVTDSVAHLFLWLKEHGITESVADQAAWAAIDNLIDNFGGQQINFPKEYHFNIRQRDIEIYEQFNGKNHLELARKYNVTSRVIYKIVQKMRQRYVDARQPKLF